MSSSESKNSSNLSGVWSGVYCYPGVSSPVSFTATLAQTSDWITGTTEEIGHCADAANKAITATLQGRRDGARVTWLKLYDRIWLTYDAVSYRGEVNEDVSEISGRWMTGPDWSGTFLMIRAPAKTLASSRATGEKIGRAGRVNRNA